MQWLSGRRGRTDLVLMEGLSGATEMFSISFWTVVVQVYTSVRTHWDDTLISSRHVCKLHFF